MKRKKTRKKHFFQMQERKCNHRRFWNINIAICLPSLLEDMLLKRAQCPGRGSEESYSVQGPGMSNLWTFFRWAAGEVIRSQRRQPSGSLWSGFHVLVSSTQLISLTWWGSQPLQNSSKDMAQSISYSPWGGTKVLDFVYWLTYYHFVLLDCFPFCIFSLLWINLFLD